MTTKPPMFLNLFQIKFPITAIASILHRLSGVLLFFSIPLLLCLLENSLFSADNFIGIKKCSASLFGKISIWLIASAIFYHLLAGIRHMLMDIGVGEEKCCSTLSARLVIILASVLSAAIGGWLW